MLRHRVLLTVLPLVAVAMAAVPARGDTVIQFLGDSASNHTASGWFGQSFTTPGGGPWDHIIFNFYTEPSGNQVPYAVGTAVLLNKEYTGEPDNLSASTPGYMDSVLASGNAYQFDSTIQVDPNTQYFIYMTTNQGAGALQFEEPGTYAGGIFYDASGYANEYGRSSTEDAPFQLLGDPVSEVAATPLPGMMQLGGVLLPLAFLGLGTWRKKKVVEA